jgi:Core-2/I-Branching enzyme
MTAVAYLVQSHRDPDQVLRLVRRLRAGSPTSVVHVSHDVRGERLDDAALAALGVTVRYEAGGYGDYSNVRRYLDAVAWLRDTAQPVDWVVNLTGQDYPLRPVPEIEADLEGADADGFLEYFDCFGPDSPWPLHRARSRYQFRHKRLVPLTPRRAVQLRPLQALNRVQPLVRVHVAYGLAVGLRRRSIFGPGLRLYGGSAYSSLRWAAALHLLETAETDRRLVDVFAHALSPVEAFSQTVLVNSGRFRLVDDPRRYFDFRDSRLNHPKTLTAEDLPRALASGADFGRKFDVRVDATVLDELDRIVVGAARG